MRKDSEEKKALHPDSNPRPPDAYLNCTKWPEELPQNVLFRFRRQVVNEDAPAAAVQGCLGRIGSAGWQQGVGSKEITGQR